MREIRIIRPKQAKGAAGALIVEIDGVKAGKLAGGKELTLPVDENAHTLKVHGGALAGKAYSDELPIPAGLYGYCFQIDMMDVKSTFKPVLLACGGTAEHYASRTMQLIGVTLTQVLLGKQLRDIAAKLPPEACFQLNLGVQDWNLAVSLGGAGKVLLTQPYSHVRGGMMALAMNTIENGNVDTPEHRAAFTEKLLATFVDCLPECRRVGPKEFTLRP